MDRSGPSHGHGGAMAVEGSQMAVAGSQVTPSVAGDDTIITTPRDFSCEGDLLDMKKTRMEGTHAFFRFVSFVVLSSQEKFTSIMEAMVSYVTDDFGPFRERFQHNFGDAIS